ncbi:hypothetical protein JL722_9135 [Aureococcus anophagefferens]|nr:hypothetical protein JL722_9135 [Aureococcus anophagefferens]
MGIRAALLLVVRACALDFPSHFLRDADVAVEQLVDYDANAEFLEISSATGLPLHRYDASFGAHPYDAVVALPGDPAAYRQRGFHFGGADLPAAGPIGYAVDGVPIFPYYDGDGANAVEPPPGGAPADRDGCWGFRDPSSGAYVYRIAPPCLYGDDRWTYGRRRRRTSASARGRARRDRGGAGAGRPAAALGSYTLPALAAAPWAPPDDVFAWPEAEVGGAYAYPAHVRSDAYGESVYAGGGLGAAAFCPAGSAAPTRVRAGHYTVGAATLERGNASDADAGASPRSPASRATARLGRENPCPPGSYGASSGLADVACDGPCAPGYYCERGSATPTQTPAARRRSTARDARRSPSARATTAPRRRPATRRPAATRPASRRRRRRRADAADARGASGPASPATLRRRRAAAVPAGTYGSTFGETSATCAGLCPPGMFCVEASTEAKPVANGTYCAPPGGCRPCCDARRDDATGLWARHGDVDVVDVVRLVANEATPRHLHGAPGEVYDVDGWHQHDRHAPRCERLYCPAGSARPLNVTAGRYAVGGNRTTRSAVADCAGLSSHGATLRLGLDRAPYCPTTLRDEHATARRRRRRRVGSGRAPGAHDADGTADEVGAWAPPEFLGPDRDYHDGAERCVPFGAFDVARDACARRAALVAPAAATRSGRAPGLLRARAVEDVGGVECAAAMQLQARVAACKLDDEAAQLEAISLCAKAAALRRRRQRLPIFGRRQRRDAAPRGTMAKIGEVCATFGGNVDAALPALNEALTCYRPAAEAAASPSAARVERAMAHPGALLGAYDFAVVVEEGDLAPRADSPRAAVVAALDLGELFKAKANVDASARTGRPRWALKASSAPLEDQAPDANVRSMRSNAHHPAFFRVHDAVDRESDDSSVSDDEAGVTYDQCVRKAGHPRTGPPEDRYLTHVTLTFDDDVAACARAVAGDTVDAALAALPDLECGKSHWPKHKAFCSTSGPTEPKPNYIPPKYHAHSYDGKDHRTPEKKMQDAVMAQMGMY